MLVTQVLQTTVPLKTSFTSSIWDLFRLILLVCYIAILFLYFATQIDDVRLAALQYRTAAVMTVRRLRSEQLDTPEEQLRAAVMMGGNAEIAYISKVLDLLFKLGKFFGHPHLGHFSCRWCDLEFGATSLACGTL